MATTIVATPEPTNVPPRVRLDLATNDSSLTFTELTVSRDGRKIREQPFAGSTVALAYDYEAPFGTPVVYSVAGIVSDFNSIYSTAWPNLTGWTTQYGSPAVTGGKLYSPTGVFSRVSRSITLLTNGRLTIGAGMVGTDTGLYLGTGSSGEYVLGVGGWTTPGQALVGYGAGSSQVVDLGSGSTVLTFDPLGVTITTTAGTWRVNRGDPTPPYPYLSADVSATTDRMPGLTLQNNGTPASATATASTTLSVDAAWLIHPSQPGLSIPIDFGPQGGRAKLRFIEASSGESRTSAAQSTIHRPVGRRHAVVITPGPRQADEWTLTVGAPTIEQKNAVRALVDDQTPLLLRSPSGKSQDLPDDWYSVGDVEVSRVQAPVFSEMTLIKLPLIPVDEPIVRQGALWTYGTDLLAHPTYSSSRAALPTYLDRLAGSS